MKYVDLHIHSYFSDGIHSPAELVRMAAERNLAAIAIADHDSVSSIDEALGAATSFNVEVIPAVELSVEYGHYRDMHILGYYIDHRDRELQQKLAEFRSIRDNRGKAIVEKINRRLAARRESGISYDEVLATAGEAVGRPHIARILVEKGYSRDMEDAFRKFLIPCDVPKLYMPAKEAIAEIWRVGGVAVLAHPTTVTDERNDLRKLVGDLAALGLDGIEVFNNMCFKDDMLFLEKIAYDFGLIMTGGSDYHGIEDDVEIGIGRGGLAVSYRLAESLKALACSRRGECRQK